MTIAASIFGAAMILGIFPHSRIEYLETNTGPP